MKSKKIKRPSFMFYPADWSADIKLRSTSIAARGLWLEIMCIMHQSDRYGFLPTILTPVSLEASWAVRLNAQHATQVDAIVEVMRLNPLFCDKLSRMVGAPEANVREFMLELSAAEVFAFEDGRVYSKRMVKDEEIRNIRSEVGRKGGNPNLKKETPAVIPAVVPRGKSAVKAVVAPAAVQNNLFEGSSAKVKTDEAGNKFVGDQNLAWYSLSAEGDAGLLSLHITPEGMAWLKSRYPDEDIEKYCRTAEWYWNGGSGPRGIAKRPTSKVHVALSNMIRAQIKRNKFKQGQTVEEPSKVVMEFVTLYNTIVSGYAPLITLPITVDRVTLIKSAVKKFPSIEYWEDVFTAIKTHKLPPNCGFDWLIKDESNWVRVKERTFEPRVVINGNGSVNDKLRATTADGTTVSRGFPKK